MPRKLIEMARQAEVRWKCIEAYIMLWVILFCFGNCADSCADIFSGRSRVNCFIDL